MSSQIKRTRLQNICATVPPRSCGTRGCPLAAICKLFGYRVPEILTAEEINQFYDRYKKKVKPNEQKIHPYREIFPVRQEQKR